MSKIDKDKKFTIAFTLEDILDIRLLIKAGKLSGFSCYPTGQKSLACGMRCSVWISATTICTGIEGIWKRW